MVKLMDEDMSSEPQQQNQLRLRAKQSDLSKEQVSDRAGWMFSTLSSGELLPD